MCAEHTVKASASSLGGTGAPSPSRGREWTGAPSPSGRQERLLLRGDGSAFSFGGTGVDGSGRKRLPPERVKFSRDICKRPTNTDWESFGRVVIGVTANDATESSNPT
jgi:hypothetical protein